MSCGSRGSVDGSTASSSIHLSITDRGWSWHLVGISQCMRPHLCTQRTLALPCRGKDDAGVGTQL